MRRLVAALALLSVPALAVLASPASASATPATADPTSVALTVTVAVGGRPIDDRAVPIDPNQPVALLITAANNGQSAQHVRTVRFSGGVLGLSFFGYDTTVPFDVAPHESATRTLVLDLGDLRGQAIGLMPATVDLLDEGGSSLGSVDTVTDVRGSIVSLYGALGLVLLVFAAAAWTSAVRALARRERQESRGRAVLRFLPAGIGTGLLAVVWLSVFRLVAPEPFTALGMVLVGVLAGLIAASIAVRPEYVDLHDEALTTIIDPTVGVKTGVLDPVAAKPAADENDDENDDEDIAHSGNLEDLDDFDEPAEDEEYDEDDEPDEEVDEDSAAAEDREDGEVDDEDGEHDVPEKEREESGKPA